MLDMILKAEAMVRIDSHVKNCAFQSLAMIHATTGAFLYVHGVGYRFEAAPTRMVIPIRE